jgi:hypothetical protein
MVYQELPDPRVLLESLVKMEIMARQVSQEYQERKELKGPLDQLDQLDQKGSRVAQGIPVKMEQMVVTEKKERKGSLENREKEEKGVLVSMVPREIQVNPARMVRKEKLVCPAHLD